MSNIEQPMSNIELGASSFAVERCLLNTLFFCYSRARSRNHA